MTKDNSKKNLVDTFIVMGSTLLSRILGFVKNKVIAMYFGGGAVADALHFVFIIPNTFRKITAEGGLSTAFIPVLTNAIERDKTLSRSHQLASNIIGFLLITLLPLITVSVIFAQPIMEIIYDNPENLPLATDLFRWFIWYLFFISISALMMGVLNSHGKFLISALTPILFSLMIIFALVFFTSSFYVHAMSLGILAGGLAQIFFQWPLFRRMGYRLFPSFRFNNADFKQVLVKWAPSVGIALSLIVAQIWTSSIATGLGAGRVAAIQNSLLFYHVPLGLFGVSITTVFFPRMSRFRAMEDHRAVSRTFFQGLGFLAVLLIPSSVALFFLGRELISVLLLGGEFTLEDVRRTHSVLQFYVLGLYGIGSFSFIQRFFFSIGKYKTPMMIALFTGALDISLSLWLSKTSLEVQGLAISNSISFTAAFIVSLLLTLPYIDFGAIPRYLFTLLKVVLGAGVLGVGLFMYQLLRNDAWVSGPTIENMLFLTGAIVLGAFLVLGIYYLMRIDVLSILLKRKKDIEEHIT